MATVLVALLASPAGAVHVPPDFTISIVGTDLDGAVNFDFLPDGRLVLVEQFTGHIRVASIDGGVLSDPIGRVPDLRTGVFDGLLGVAVDPRWPEKPYLYVHAVVASSPNIKVLRHQVTGDLDGTGDGVLVLDSLATREILADLPRDGELHRGGSLQFGPDGMLYVTTGDDGFPCSAQDLDQLRGKILRLDVMGVPDGPGPAPGYASLVAPGNPFAASPNIRSRLIYHFGLRNPWHIDFDPVQLTLAIADVGNEQWEEVNVTALPGRNFGWPLFEGPDLYQPECDEADLSTLTMPSFAYAQDSLANAFSVGLGGVCYRPMGVSQSFPPDYWGQVFYYDFFAGRLNRLVCSDGACVPAPPVEGQPAEDAWGLGFAGVFRMRFGPDGALWYIQGNELRRLRYSGTIDAPPAPGSDPGSIALAATPNPAAGAMRLELSLPRPAAVRLEFHDVRGRVIRRLLGGDVLSAGIHRLSWNGRDDAGREVPPGVYFASVTAGGESATRRVVRIRG